MKLLLSVNSSNVCIPCLFNLTHFNYRVQNAVLSCMELGVNIAHNIALRENVFMMAVCVELKIPLFVVGKPGSSKSLAKSILAESMKGQNSKHPFLREFKAVSLFCPTVNAKAI